MPGDQTMTITIRYTSIDHINRRRSFKTLEGARAYAVKQVGEYPEMGGTYAVSGDGIGKITVVEGTTLAELFRDVPTYPETDPVTGWVDDGKPMPRRWYSTTTGELLSIEDCRAKDEELALEARGPDRPYRSAGCTCSDSQLIHVGCDCYADFPF
jgi:hypothetical protein